MPNPVNEPETHAYLTNFYVVPKIRGGGLGTKLLNKALFCCRARDVDAVILWATVKANRFIAGAASINLPIFWSSEVPLFSGAASFVAPW